MPKQNLKRSESAGQFKIKFILGVVLFFIALGLRVFFFNVKGNFIIFIKYTVLAQEIVCGTDLGNRLLDVSPFYLWLMTLVTRSFPSFVQHMPMAQLFVGVVVCLLIYALGAKVINVQAGFAAGLIYAMYGNAMVLESTLEPIVFVLLFNIIAVYLLVGVDASKPVYIRVVMAGVFAGLSIITKPNFLLFLPVAAIWLYFSPKPRANAWKKIALPLVFIITAFAVISPVTIRNYIKFNEFILVTADYGKVFFHGNAGNTTVFLPQNLPGQNKTPPGQIDVDYPHVFFREKASEMAGRTLSASESARFWMLLTLKDVFGRPAHHLKLEFKKLVLFFLDYEVYAIGPSHWQYRNSLRYPFLRYGIISSLGVLGMILCLRRKKELGLVYGVFFVYLASCLIFVVNSRYRAPAIPYLCLFAGAAIQYTAGFFAEKKSKAFTASLIVLLILLAATHLAYKQEVRYIMQLISDMYPVSDPSTW